MPPRRCRRRGRSCSRSRRSRAARRRTVTAGSFEWRRMPGRLGWACHRARGVEVRTRSGSAGEGRRDWPYRCGWRSRRRRRTWPTPVRPWARTSRVEGSRPGTPLDAEELSVDAAELDGRRSCCRRRSRSRWTRCRWREPSCPRRPASCRMQPERGELQDRDEPAYDHARDRRAEPSIWPRGRWSIR